MIDPLTRALLIGGGGAAAYAAWSSWHRRADDHAARESARARRRECEAVVRRFLNTHGYVSREVATGTELEGWITDGILPAELYRLLRERMDAVPGPLLGHQLAREGRLPVRLPMSLRTRHIYSVGRTGSGKTTLVQNYALQAIAAGEGLAVLSPEPELIYEQLLPHIPEHRWPDVVLVEPTDYNHPVGFNPLYLADGEDLDLKVAELMAVFQRLCEEGTTGAPRMETILRQVLYALVPLPETTLLDVEPLLDRQDDTFRRWVIEHSADEDTRHFWSTTYPSYPRDAGLSLTNRLGRFIRPRTVRTMLCATPRSFDVRGAMDQGKVLLFPLSDGLIGEENAAFLGQLIVAKIQLAAMSRANVPAHKRRFFTLVADEFQRFISAASSYEQILSRARKYNLGLLVAHQETGQIPEHLMRGILGNVGTLVIFQVGATDARRLSRELVGEIDGEPLVVDGRELLGLHVGQAICRVGRNVFRLNASPPLSGGSARTRQIIQEYSRRQFATPVSEPGLIERRRSGTDDLDPGAVF